MATYNIKRNLDENGNVAIISVDKLKSMSISAISGSSLETYDGEPFSEDSFKGFTTQTAVRDSDKREFVSLMMVLKSKHGNITVPLSCGTRLGTPIEGGEIRNMLPDSKYIKILREYGNDYEKLFEKLKEFFSEERTTKLIAYIPKGKDYASNIVDFEQSFQLCSTYQH